MRNRTLRLILGSVLMIQAPACAISPSHFSADAEPLALPEHRFVHATITDSEFDAPGADYARFVYETAEGSLPASYKGEARLVAQSLITEANRHGFDPLLLIAVIKRESRFNPEAKGRHGEIGLMQVKPSTARWLLATKGEPPPSLDETKRLLRNPVENIRIGAAYLAHLKTSFRGRPQHFISAFNMGPSKLRSRLRENVHPRIYLDQVIGHYQTLAGDLVASQGLRDAKRVTMAPRLETIH